MTVADRWLLPDGVEEILPNQALQVENLRRQILDLRRNGPSRLCYAGTVLYTKPRYPLASRSPIQIGVELYGEAGLAADIEVISLMVATLQLAGLEKPQLDLGHVGIYGNLLEEAGLAKEQEAELFDLLQRKSVPELDAWVASNINDKTSATMIRALVDLAGDATVLDRARARLPLSHGGSVCGLCSRYWPGYR